jgi:hypothetical protein
MALHEKTVMDGTLGRIVNDNLADYDYPRSRRIARQDRRQVALRNQRNAIIAKQFRCSWHSTRSPPILWPTRRSPR